MTFLQPATIDSPSLLTISSMMERSGICEMEAARSPFWSMIASQSPMPEEGARRTWPTSIPSFFSLFSTSRPRALSSTEETNDTFAPIEARSSATLRPTPPCINLTEPTFLPSGS